MKSKSLLTGIIASMMLLSTPVFALAEAENVGNSNTGKNSENTVDVRIENTTEIDIDNDANVDNNISVSAKTGGNKVGENTNITMQSKNVDCENNEETTSAGDESIDTGNANASATVSNIVNSTDINVEKEENEAEEEEDGQGGGPTVTPEGGIGGGEEQLAAAAVAEGGIGGGAEEIAGIGGGPLAEAGAEGLIAPLMLSSIVTFLTWMRRKNLFKQLS